MRTGAQARARPAFGGRFQRVIESAERERDSRFRCLQRTRSKERRQKVSECRRRGWETFRGATPSMEETSHLAPGEYTRGDRRTPGDNPMGKTQAIMFTITTYGTWL